MHGAALSSLPLCPPPSLSLPSLSYHRLGRRATRPSPSSTARLTPINVCLSARQPCYSPRHKLRVTPYHSTLIQFYSRRFCLQLKTVRSRRAGA